MNARRFVASWALIGLLFALKLASAKGGGDDDDEDKEIDPATGLVHYFATRTLLEQEALLEAEEAFIQSGQLMDFMPVGGAALMDLYKLGKEGVGAAIYDEDESDYFYQRNDKNGRYEKYDSKFEHHLERLIPYYKNWWAVQHPYEATENYMFGRKLRTR